MSSEFGERLEMAQDAFNDLLQERDTLIIALRECVVALELMKPVRDQMLTNTKTTNAFDSALTHAKSVLDKYAKT